MSGRKRAFRVSGCALVLDGRKQSGYGPLSMTGAPPELPRRRLLPESASRPPSSSVSMLLIFDCDGVVVNSMHLHTEVESEAFRSVGISVTPKELALRFSGVGDAEVHRILSQESGRAIPARYHHPDRAAKKGSFCRAAQTGRWNPGSFEEDRHQAPLPRLRDRRRFALLFARDRGALRRVCSPHLLLRNGP